VDAPELVESTVGKADLNRTEAVGYVDIALRLENDGAFGISQSEQSLAVSAPKFGGYQTDL